MTSAGVHATPAALDLLATQAPVCGVTLDYQALMVGDRSAFRAQLSELIRWLASFHSRRS